MLAIKNKNINIIKNIKNIKNYDLKIFRSVILLGIAICTLSSCAQKVTPKFLRNREYDYEKQAVVQLPKIKVPEGAQMPESDPKYVLPAGKDQYPPAKKQIKVLPPPTLLDNKKVSK